MSEEVKRLYRLVDEFTTQHRIMAESTITEVLGAAFEIYFQAELLKVDPGDATLKERAYVEKCAQAFLKVLKQILGTEDEIEVLAKMEQRSAGNKIEGMDTGFLPGQTVQLNHLIDPFTSKTKAQFNWRNVTSKVLALKRGQLMVVEPGSRLRDQGVGLGAKPTRMFSKIEREKYRVFFTGGAFRKFDRVSLQMERYNTLGMESHGKLHFAAYVIDADGAMFAFNHLDKSDQVAHSSLVNGGPVRAAGEICIVRGVLQVLTTHSGHYRPGRENLHQTLLFFTKKGIDLGSSLVHFLADPGLNSPKRQLPVIRPTEPALAQLLQDGDISPEDVKAYLSLTKFIYRASDILNELGN